MTPYPSDKNLAVDRTGRVFRIANPGSGRTCPYELKRRVDGHGYLTVGGRKATRRVHRMVAETFLPNPELLPEVAHRNGVKLDCRVDNLRWSTRVDNLKDMDLHGTRPVGSMQPAHKLTEPLVKALRQRRAAGEGPVAIAADYPLVSRQTIGKALAGKTWKHVTA